MMETLAPADIAPGRVVGRPAMTDGGFLYVVHRGEAELYGVRIAHEHNATVDRYEWQATGWATVPIPDRDTYSYPLTEVNEWPAAVASFLGNATTTTDASASTGGDPEEAYQRGRDDQRAASLREFEAWKQSATETAHRYADNNSLCSEFDRCMEEIGLEPREREYEVEIEVTYMTTVVVNASSQESAEEYVSDDPWSYIDTYSLRDNASVEIG